MTSIQKRPNGMWRARYRDAAGREHARHFGLKRDAERWLDEVTAATLTGQYVDPRAGRMNFRDYAEQWRQSQVHREQTADQYESKLRLHAYPTLGSKRIADIRASTIQGWVRSLGTSTDEHDALAPSTIGLVYKIVSGIFRSAVRDRLIATSPCADVRLPKVGKTRVTPITTEQVDVLRETLPGSLQALVTLAAGTGMRQGEVLGLTRDRLRLLGANPAVTVDRQLVTRSGGRTEFGPVKTEASNRVIPLPRVAVDALNDHIATYGIDVDELLFTVGGAGITRARFGHVWRPAATAARLTASTGTGMHALRHYYASLLIRYGESVKTVQARLGHASAAETLDTYSHLWPDSDDRTRAAVDSVLLRTPGGLDSASGH